MKLQFLSSIALVLLSALGGVAAEEPSSVSDGALEILSDAKKLDFVARPRAGGIQCIGPTIRLRRGESLSQACAAQRTKTIPYTCDEGGKLCCEVTGDQNMDTTRLPGYGTCHRMVVPESKPTMKFDEDSSADFLKKEDGSWDEEEEDSVDFLEEEGRMKRCMMCRRRKGFPRRRCGKKCKRKCPMCKGFNSRNEGSYCVYCGPGKMSYNCCGRKDLLEEDRDPEEDLEDSWDPEEEEGDNADFLEEEVSRPKKRKFTFRQCRRNGISVKRCRKCVSGQTQYCYRDEDSNDFEINSADFLEEEDKRPQGKKCICKSKCKLKGRKGFSMKCLRKCRASGGAICAWEEGQNSIAFEDPFEDLLEEDRDPEEDLEDNWDPEEEEGDSADFLEEE